MENSLDMLAQSKEAFLEYVRWCNGEYKIISPSFYLYKEIIAKHHAIKTAEAIFQDSELHELVYITLIAWNMNQRGAKLVPFDTFTKSIYEHQTLLQELYNYHLTALTEQDFGHILAKLKQLFTGIQVMESKSKIVGVSKTLHFLLPNLVMPMDRRYTMQFFYGHNKYSTDSEKEFQTFSDIFTQFWKIIKKLNLTDADIDQFNWNTSVPKLIDNALIGYKNSLEEVAK